MRNKVAAGKGSFPSVSVFSTLVINSASFNTYSAIIWETVNVLLRAADPNTRLLISP